MQQTPSYEGNKFEALALRYQDHVELLRSLTQIDLRIATALVTVQLVLGGFIATQQSLGFVTRLGLIFINIGVCIFAFRLLYLNYVRRREAVATLKNLNSALGFSEKGIYLPDRAINPSKEEFAQPGKDFRPWLRWYLVIVGLCVVGLIVIVFGFAPQPVSKTGQSASVLSDKIGYSIVAYLRHDSFHHESNVPMQPTNGKVHGPDISVTGKLIGVDKEGVLIEDASLRKVYWIPRDVILYIDQSDNR